MSYRNRMTKPKRQYNLLYWVKNMKAVLEPECFEKRFGKTGHKTTYNQKGYSETVDVVSGKYIGWKGMSYKKRSLKKRHRFYAHKVIAEQLLFMEEMKPCSYCGSDFCENPKSCKDEEEMLCAFEIEMYEREMEDYFLYDLEEEPSEDDYYEDAYLTDEYYWY